MQYPGLGIIGYCTSAAHYSALVSCDRCHRCEMRTLLAQKIPEALDLRGLQRFGVTKIRLESDAMRTLLLQRHFLNPLILKGVPVKRVC